MSRIGERTHWHATSCTHWDIRRFATIPGIVSEQVRSYPDAEQLEDAEKLFGVGNGLSGSYSFSCSRMMPFRFGWYDDALPAYGGYRRTSLDFKLHVDEELKLLAYAKPGDDDDLVFLSVGIGMALEEACHIIFSGREQVFFNDGFDLWTHSSDEALESFGMSQGGRPARDIMRDYSVAFRDLNDNEAVYNIQRKIKEITEENKITSDVIGFFGKPDDFSFLHMCFSRISLSSTRQAIADEFSALCMSWLIGHEDAHKYLGHIRHFFGTMGVIEFDELKALGDGGKHCAQRCASELDADTCAMQRQVDLAYDVEFVGMIFDSVDSKIRQNIWQGRLEVDGLDFNQRNFALRYIAGSAVVPLLVLELSRMRIGQRYSPDYPPLFVRLLNLGFETLNRAMAVERHKPHHKTGSARDPIEIFNFFSCFLHDVKAIYIELGLFCLEPNQSLDDAFPLGSEFENFFTSAMALEMTFLICELHQISLGNFSNSPNAAEIIRSRSEMEKRASRENFLTFMRLKRDSLEVSLTEFLGARIKVNNSDETRLAKIKEDMVRVPGNVAYLDDIIARRIARPE